MKKISVIVPLYNSEAYIGQCLGSAAGQTYKNLEILVVDDGSTDKSPEICRELAVAEKRIRLLRQENRGVSAARNRGLEEAAGEYIFFLDSDDMIHPCLLEELLGQAEKNRAQLAFCGYRRGDGRQEQGDPPLFPDDGEKRTEARALAADQRTTEEWFHVKYTDILSGIGGKLILREAIGEKRFDTGLTNGEDTFFLYQIIREQVRSVFCPEEWYYYRVHSQSATGSPETARGNRYFESARRIRNGEYERGCGEYAVRWEILAADQIRRSYTARREGKYSRDGREIRRLKEIAAGERRHPLFKRICLSDRVLFFCCFTCYPLYVLLNKAALRLTKGRNR